MYIIPSSLPIKLPILIHNSIIPHKSFGNQPEISHARRKSIGAAGDALIRIYSSASSSAAPGNLTGKGFLLLLRDYARLVCGEASPPNSNNCAGPAQLRRAFRRLSAQPTPYCYRLTCVPAIRGYIYPPLSFSRLLTICRLPVCTS